MLRKVLDVGVCLMLSINLFGCGKNNTVKSEVVDGANSTFVVVERTTSYSIVYDQETKVMYTLSRGNYNTGNFTMLVNSDGTPKLYEEK